MPKQQRPQTEFDGFRPPHIAEIDEAAEAFRLAKAAHQETGETMKAAAEELAGRMLKHDIRVYPITKTTVAFLENKVGVSIKRMQGLGTKPDTGEER